MIPARVDFGDEVWRLIAVAVAVLQPVLVIVLCAMFVLAIAHLLTMFGTRWGNKRVSGKAFAFSIGVHLALACGIVALWPEVVQSYFLRRDAEDEQEERIRVEQILVETPVEVPRDPGDRAVWEQLPEMPPPEWERTPTEWAPDQEMVPTRPETPELASLATPEQTPLPLESAVLPVAADSMQQGPVEPAAVPLEVPSEPAISRAEVQVPLADRVRTTMSPETVPTETPERPRLGQAQRLAPDPEFDSTSVAGVEEEQASLAIADEAANIVRREGPAPSTLDVEQMGAQVEQPSPASAASGSAQPRIARDRTRTPRSTNDTGVERFRPATVPQQPDENSPDPTQSMLAATPGDLPSLERPDLEITDDADGMAVPAPYRMRADDQRDEATRRFGGTAESEQAVAASLAWLAANQHPNGYWDADQHGAGAASRGRDGIDRENAGKYSDTGITGLAVLAFLAPGNTPREGEYADNVERALRWLIAQQNARGSIAGRIQEGAVAFMYCHAIATFALAEAYAIDNSAEWLREPVEQAVRYTLSAQQEDGGWRYGRHLPAQDEDGDMSIFGWQLMSLKSAELAGIPIPTEVRDKMIQFLINRGRGRSGGLASYGIQTQESQDRITPPMTAEALFCKQMLGMARTNSASLEAVEYLRQYPPRRTQANFYYWYYGTLAMFQYGEEPWEEWNETLRELLVFDQRTSGPLAGSWDPNGLWGGYGGRVYSTAVATLCLEVYYRYHPLYRMGERFEQQPAAAP